MQTIGQSFANPYRAVENARASHSRSDYMNQKTSQLPQLMDLRQRAQKLREQSEGLRRDQMNFMNSLREQQLHERMREFDENMNLRKQNPGGVSPTAEMNAEYRSGMPVIKTLMDGSRVSVAQGTNSQRNQMESVLTAVPQAIPLLSTIMQGAQYTQTAGGSLKEYFSSLNAYLRDPSKVSRKQQDILAKAGLSQTALISLVETVTRIMNLAKTNESAQMLMNQLAPRKGQTPQSYYQQLKFLTNDYAKRFYQAQYQRGNGFGVYINDRNKLQPGDDPDQLLNNYNKDMNKFISAMMAKNQFGFPESEQDNGSSKLSQMSTSGAQSGMQSEESLIKRIREKHPDLSVEDAANAAKVMMGLA